MTSLLSTQCIVALDICFWFFAQGQLRGRRINLVRYVRLAVDQPVQKIEDMSLGGDTCVQRQLDCAEDRLLIVLKDQRQDLAISRSPPARLRRWLEAAGMPRASQ